MKATEQLFPVVLFILLYKVGQGGYNFWVCRRNPNVCRTTQMKASERYFLVVLFIMLYNVVSNV